MFAVLRLLFVLLVVLWGICLWQERRSGDPFWRRARRWVQMTGLLVIMIITIGLFIERLAG
ncbi:hypothetical protein [Chitinimonas naiadis]